MVDIFAPFPMSVTESDAVELQADEQHAASGAGKMCGGRLTGEGTRWIEVSYPGRGTSVWRASHSTSRLRPKSDLSF